MLYSIWNETTKAWATTTNYSTKAEAEALLAVITRWCRDTYVVRGRKFGSIGHQDNA